VLTPSGSGTGRAGSACVANTFNIVPDLPTSGAFDFIPATEVVLAVGETCIIDFTVSVNAIPAFDVSGASGVQTFQLSHAAGVSVGQCSITTTQICVNSGECPGMALETCVPIPPDITLIFGLPADTSGTDITTVNASIPSAVAVPTMTEWGIIIFMMLAGVSSIFYLRKYRRA
jgi:hypothetical protein